ncbi:MAG: beta-N-acetylhexosaminidase [Clostridia bacterium]|nr:beta-N-acetylhexosaminidase [Clostridia bacterium]
MKHFDSFGVMIDCSRDAVPSVGGLKRFLKAVASMGYNVAMLYTEDTYEVENEPYFGYKRGRYSVEELREIDAYAASVGIELIPFIQTLAHLNQLKRWRAYRHKIFDIDDILLIDEPKTYALLENIFSTLSKAFRSRRVHIGMDEAHHVGLGKYLDTHGFTDRYALLTKHLKRVCEIAEKYGFTSTMMANDLFFNLSPGVFCSDEVRDFPPAITENIPRNCEMVYWDYFATDEARYDAMMRSTQKLSEKSWFSGGAWTWNTFTPHNRYSMKRNEIAIEACIRNGVRQAFFTLWGDNGGECAYESVLPALMHAAAVARGISEDEMKREFLAITGERFDDMMDLDLPNYIFGADVPVESPYFQHSACNYAKTHLYDDPFLGTMSASLQTEDNSLFPQYAERLHSLAEASERYGLLYETAACLCDALSKKLLLAKKTGALYEKGDKQGLLALAQNDYAECIRLVDAFHKAFRRQWYAVNKTFGFEVHDARLGGLKCRLESCMERLTDYAEDRISDIAELDEPLLPYKDTYVTSWAEMISANIV